MKLLATILLGAIAGLFLAGIIMSLSGCAGSQPPPATPANLFVVGQDCLRCAADIYQLSKGRPAVPDAGTAPAVP